MTAILIIVAGIAITGLIGLPVGAGLALTGFAILHFVAGNATSLSVPAVWNVFINFTLSAVPLYVLMGEVLLASGVSTRLYNAIAPLFQRVPGRLLHTNIAACTLFGSVSAASMSTAAAIGSVAYPELARRGYYRPLVVGTLAAGGTLGLLIPPSNSLLIFGATQDVSVGRLFLAGVIPGVMMALLFMGMIYFQNWRNPSLTTAEPRQKSAAEIVIGLLKMWPFAILVFSVLGTIYTGLATPTEAAGLGVATAVVLGFTWGTLTLRSLFRALLSATFTFGNISFVMAGALILAQAISILGLPYQITQAVAALALSKYVVLIVVVLIYFILGCFFDGISLLLMTLPLVFPVMKGLGFDPVWLGVVITILIEIGMLTPPVGMNLYVLVAVARGEVTLEEASKASIPYWVLLLFGVFLLTLFPEIALFLPRLLD